MDDKETAQNNFSMLNKVKIALQEDLIRPFFQPIVNLETKEPIKYEALVRLIDEDKAISVITSYSIHYTKLYETLL